MIKGQRTRIKMQYEDGTGHRRTGYEDIEFHPASDNTQRSLDAVGRILNGWALDDGDRAGYLITKSSPVDAATAQAALSNLYAYIGGGKQFDDQRAYLNKLQQYFDGLEDFK